MSRRTLASVALLVAAVLLVNWNIVFTNQFSLASDQETVRQAYSWFTYWLHSVRCGQFPLWDPYTFSGHSAAGEMQTAVFYPFRLLLLFIGTNRHGLLPAQGYSLLLVLDHVLSAVFMFALAREWRLSYFSSLISGLCFALNTFLAAIRWPHIIESCIWLPLILLFAIRALRAPTRKTALVYSVFSGLCLGLSILAGGSTSYL